MSNPTVVEYCVCDVPKVAFDSETAQTICTSCGGVINESERVIVNLAMLKLNDKLDELIELTKYMEKLSAEVKQLTLDWAEALK